MNINKIYEGIKKEVDLEKVYEKQLNEQVPDQDENGGNVPPSDKVPMQGVENVPTETTSEVPTVQKPQVTPQDLPKPDKELFGGKGKDIWYYFVRVKDGNGTISDLQIVDADNQVQFSAKGASLDVGDEVTFIKKAVEKVDTDVIDTGLINEFDLLGLKAGAEQEEQEKLKDVGLGTEKVPQSQPITEEPKSLSGEEGVV